MARNQTFHAVTVSVLLAVVVLSGHGPVARADHTSCNQIDGTNSSETIYGTSYTDEIWAFAGADTVYAGTSYFNCNSQEELHMGGGADTAYGQEDYDIIYGGDNQTDVRETLWAGSGLQNFIYDNTGPDWDKGCGGPYEDVFDFGDGDDLDSAYGSSHSYSHADKFYDGTDQDFFSQDGSC